MFNKNKIFFNIFLYLFLFCGKAFSKETEVKVDIGLTYNYSSSDSGYYSNQLEAITNIPKLGFYALKNNYEIEFNINNVTNTYKNIIINNNSKLDIQSVKDKNYNFSFNYNVKNDSYIGSGISYNQTCREVNCFYYYSSSIKFKQYFLNKNSNISLEITPNFMNYTNANIGSKVVLGISYSPTFYKF